jgi:hypothetical protein
MKYRFNAVLGLVVLCLGASCTHDADSADKSPTSGGAGNVRLGLAIANGIDLDSVHYTVKIPGYTALEGTLPVTDGKTMLGTVSGVPAASDVTVLLDGKTSNGDGTTCHGEGTVAVQTGKTTSIFVVLQCRLADGTPVTTGAIDISGRINVCPQVTSATAGAASESSFPLSAAATDLDQDDLSFAWSASAGSFDDAESASAKYTCGVAGTQTLTVTVDDGQGCTHSKEVTVECQAGSGSACSVGDAVPCDGGSADAGAPLTDAGSTMSADAGTSAPADAGTSAPADAGTSAPADAGTSAPADAGPSTASDSGSEAAPGLCEAAPVDACEECGCTSCATQMTACRTLEGAAAAGAATGTAKSALCSAVVKCGQRTGCRGTDCFCGATVDLVSCLTGSAAGPCKAEIEAAAESVDPQTVSARQSDPTFAVGRANNVSSCTVSSCADACSGS